MTERRPERKREYVYLRSIPTVTRPPTAPPEPAPAPEWPAEPLTAEHLLCQKDACQGATLHLDDLPIPSKGKCPQCGTVYEIEFETNYHDDIFLWVGAEVDRLARKEGSGALNAKD